MAADWQTRFYTSDSIGSIRRLTNESGNITDGYTYTSFGELLGHSGTDPQPYAFAGEPYDPNSGFQYHRARWMDPRAGRFVAMDPFRGEVGDPVTLHRYLYTGADPIDRIDPSGRDFTLSTQLAIGAIVGALAGSLIGGIRGGVEGAVAGAVARLLLGPVGVGIATGVGALIATVFGVSTATGVGIASAGMGVFSLWSGINEFRTARTAREELAAGITIALALAPLMLASRASSSATGVILRLRYRAGRTPDQIAAASAKVAALNQAAQAGEAARTTPVRSGAGLGQRGRARRRSSEMAAGLERRVHGRAAHVMAVTARIEQRFDFGVVRSGRLREAFAQHAAVSHDQAADARIRCCVIHGLLRQLQRAQHELVVGLAVHQSERATGR